MDNIGDLLSSISPEDMERLKNVASSLMSQSGSEPSSAPKEQGAGGNRNAPNADVSSLFGGDMTKTLMTVATQMNKEDDNTRFISALRPLLSEDRRKKADEAMKFLKLMEMLPLLKGFFNVWKITAIPSLRRCRTEPWREFAPCSSAQAKPSQEKTRYKKKNQSPTRTPNRTHTRSRII